MAYTLQPLLAFCGAFGCSLLIVFLSRRVGGGRVTLVLSGVAVSALLSAGISALRLLYPDRTQGYTAFSVGGVEGIGFDRMAVPALITLVAIVCTAVSAPRLDLLCLGDDLASALGARVKLLRTLALLLASASAAAAVSFAGLLGFVGLMVPHMARRLAGQGSTRRLLWVSALLGACLVILADLLGRVLFAPSQLPAGIVTAAIGAPFFFGLLMQRREPL
jgi:iron complex transport system permease protein